MASVVAKAYKSPYSTVLPRLPGPAFPRRPAKKALPSLGHEAGPVNLPQRLCCGPAGTTGVEPLGSRSRAGSERPPEAGPFWPFLFQRFPKLKVRGRTSSPLVLLSFPQ